MPDITIDGLNVHYQVAGQGYPFVLVHGGHLDSSNWQAQVDFFSQRYRVITYDLRGHGQSEIPAGDYSLGDCVADLGRLLDHLGVEQAFLAGHSMGGYIALSFALNCPRRVQALILTGTNCGPVVETLKAWGDEKAARLESRTAPAAKRFVKAHKANAARPDLTPRLAEIRRPVLIVVGDGDTVTPRRISEAMLKQIPGSKLEVIPGCGHMCHQEQPDTFNAMVADFLGRVEASQFVLDHGPQADRW
ncbi:MAG: alpha/beta fold hydrolase [Chloroflexi bacterium]|nr:alpha/beta fold hydrolase [Chloroflexota bacterium]